MFHYTAHFPYSIKIRRRSQENKCARPNLQGVGIVYEISSMACLPREDDNSTIIAYIFTFGSCLHFGEEPHIITSHYLQNSRETLDMKATPRHEI